MSVKQTIWILVEFLCVTIMSQPVFDDHQGKDDECAAIHCVGKEYDCINGKCYCASGYVRHPFQTSCIKCPGVGDSCHGLCCGPNNVTLQCWQGVCQQCYDQSGVWICREPLNQVLLVSAAQVALAAALVLGIFATFVLLYRFCTVRDLTSSINNNGRNFAGERRMSIGSLQLYVEQRLRDAPPRYTRSAPQVAAMVTVPAAVFYLNAGFVHDNTTTSPPPYQPPETKPEDEHPTLHI